MSITAARGFVAAGLACGIKDSGAPDLALVATEDHAPVPAAAVFTSNLAQAAPVQVSRAHLVDGRAAAVVLSSGNANAATGAAGRRDARRMCELVGDGLDAAVDNVLVCSTGLIGIPLPMPALEAGIPKVCGALTVDGGSDAAQAMLTTDTVRKEAVAAAGSAVVGGMAKGAAMLSPAMATMLAVLTTDAAVDPAELQVALARAVRDTFDCLSVDGCRSTNDTVIVLANGRSGAVGAGPLTDAVTAVCGSLAEQMARDAEGATKFVRVRVVGARTAADARIAARAVANSQLVQCSLNGGDAYWGRVLSELGASGAFIDPEDVDISYGDVTVCRAGIASDHDAARLASVMAGHDIDIHCDLNLGAGEAHVVTTDLSHAYIDENRRTS
jgi:glutamate N-acetyltransferase/amino-acid N-acetyltransferase